MKKILTTVLAAVMMLQAGICSVSAVTVLNPEYDVETPITLNVKKDVGGAYATSATINAGETVSLKSTVDMTNVRTQFTTLLALGKSKIGEAAARAEEVTGSFEVTLEYPAALVLPTTITDGVDEGGAQMAGFNAEAQNAFTETSRTITTSGSTNTLTISFDVATGITCGVLEDNMGTYLGNMWIEASGVTVGSAGAPHTVKGHISGSVTIDFADATYDVTATVNFENATDPEAVINVVTPGPGPGPGPGGSSVTSYTVTFETNGGAAIESVSYRGGREITADMLPVPEKAGYAFEGWYLDAELTEKVDSIVMKKDITLYAAWKAQEAPGGDYIPEMLNGDDHYAYIIGYPDGTIQPDESITRAEVTTIFYRLLKDEIREQYLTKENPYVDVKEEAWYNGAISTLTALGIVNGIDGEIFAPNADITRGEFAAIISRFAEKSVDIAEDFTDVDGHWAESDIYKAAAFGWIKGYEDNTFRPDREITRAEAMTLINRVLGRIPEAVSDLATDMTTWSDNSNTNAWFYIAVQEATNSHDYTRKENGYEKWDAIKENRDWSLLEQ